MTINPYLGVLFTQKLCFLQLHAFLCIYILHNYVIDVSVDTNGAMITISIYLFLAVFASINLVTTNGLIEQPIINPTDSPTLKDGDKCDFNSLNRIVCENNTLKFCGPTNIITSLPCMVRGRPGFCNCENTECVAEKPICSTDTDTDCLTPNTKLPDNLNCHKYSYCTEKNKKMILQCPQDLVYDPNTEKCLDKGMARCVKLVCPKLNNTLRLIPFPQAKNYYVLCYQGIGDVRKCSDKYHAIQNNVCHFDCKMVKKTGLFRDTNLENCKKGFYYTCKKSGGSFITIQFKCPPGKIFDENLEICTETDTCEKSPNPTPQH